MSFFCIFATNSTSITMYNLAKARIDTQTHSNEENWDGKISCFYGNKTNAMRLNNLRDTVEVYGFTLVRAGEVVYTGNDYDFSLHRNDLYINLPGFKIKTKSASDDYQGLILLIDVKTSIDSPASKDVVRTAFFPLLELKEPKIHLNEEDALRIEKIMLMIRDRIMSESLYKEKILKMLYSVLVLELMNIQELHKRKSPLSERSENLYIGFIRLLPKYYKEHHDISFYAKQLNVTPTYLSRLVKQVTSYTVLDFINQMLLSEAIWLLSNSDMPIGAIAEELHFSDQASFSKFFLRLKGIGPKDYRKKG